MTEQVSIRPATSVDAETIAHHRRAMFVDVLGPFDDADLEAMDASFIPYVRRGLEDGSYRAWLACAEDGRVVAGGGLILHEWLSYPWVRPKAEPLGPWFVTKEELEVDWIPITRVPENIALMVAGGAQAEHGYWMMTGSCPSAATFSEIELPAHWNDLLKEAEKDLGPLPG